MKISSWKTLGIALLAGALGACGARNSLEVGEPHDEDESQRLVVGLSAGGPTTCALRADRTVTCFGGKAGAPQEIPFSPAVEVAVGAERACVRTESGRVECVELSSHDASQPLDPPVEIPGIDDAVQIAVGPGHACALRKGGLLVCWGENSLGQLGNGTFTSSVAPTPVGLGPIRAVATGEFNTCALTDAGGFCWGRGGYGALGNGSSDPPNSENEKEVAEPSPVLVAGLADPRQITAGLNRACALDGPGGVVKCWGGIAGPLSPAYTFTATAVDGLDGATGVFVGYLINCVIRAGGDASCWGQSYLGDGSANASETAVDVVGLHDVQAMTGGWGHTCALVAGGEVYCWGENGFGQLGGGEVGTLVLIPTRVSL